jgi:aryl-alcohol dehydrogenase-like predicted oxidoreductase
MRKRPLGKTGLLVSELAIGTWGLSGDAYGPTEDEGTAEKVLRRALEMGFSVVDTADAYGGGKMEVLAGRLLKEHPELVVVTKGGVDRSTDPARKTFDPEFLRAAVERSVKRLGAPIPLWLMHHPSPDALHRGDAVDAIEALKKEGQILHWGVAAGDEDVARAAIDKGAEVVELAYNLTHAIDLHRISGDVMVGGCGILARSVLGYGLLAGLWAKDHAFPDGDHRNERWTRMELERRVGQLDAVRFLVKGEVHTLRGAAVRFVLANHLVSAAVLGPRTVAQLEQLVRETGGGPRYLPDDDLRQLPRALDRVGIAS